MSPQGKGGRIMLWSYKHLQRRKHMKHVCFTEGAQERGREKLFVAWKDRSSCSRGRWGRGCKVITEKCQMKKGWKSPDMMWLQGCPGDSTPQKGLWAEQHYPALGDTVSKAKPAALQPQFSVFSLDAGCNQIDHCAQWFCFCLFRK